MSSPSMGKSKTGELIDQLAEYVRAHGGWTLPKGFYVRAVTHGVLSYRCLSELSTSEQMKVLVKWAGLPADQKGTLFTIDVHGNMSTEEHTPVSYNAEAMTHELLDVMNRVQALDVRETELFVDGLVGKPQEFINVDHLESLVELPGLMWRSVHAMNGFLGPRMWMFQWGALIESDASSDAYLVNFETPMKKTKEEIANMSDHELDTYVRSLPGHDRLRSPSTRMGGGMVERISVEHGISDLQSAIMRRS